MEDHGTLPLWPEQLASYEESNMVFQLDKTYTDLMGSEQLSRFLTKVNHGYDVMHDLVGGEKPYNGEKIVLQHLRDLPDDRDSQSGQTIKWDTMIAVRQLYKMQEVKVDLTETPLLTLGQCFYNEKWAFEPNALAVLNTYYYFDQTGEAFSVNKKDYFSGIKEGIFTGKEGYKTYIESHANSDEHAYVGSIKGLCYDKSIAKGSYSPYGLAYTLAGIAEQVDWNPFKQTFREIGALDPQFIPQTDIGKFNLFLTTLSQNSGQEVFSMFSEQEKAVYEKKLGGKITSIAPTWTPVLTETADGYEFDIVRNPEYIDWPLLSNEILKKLVPVFSFLTPVSEPATSEAEEDTSQESNGDAQEQDFIEDVMIEPYLTEENDPVTGGLDLSHYRGGTSEKEYYDSMDERAKELFLYSISHYDKELYDYYVENVDPEWDVEFQGDAATPFSADTTTIIINNLGAYLDKIAGMPVDVKEAFLALGLSIVTPLTDGPLPVADLVALVVATLSTGVIIANFDYIAGHWDEIVNAFGQAFTGTSILSILRDSFADAYAQSPLQKLIAISSEIRKSMLNDSADRHMPKSDIAHIVRSQQAMAVYRSTINDLYLFVYKVSDGVETGVANIMPMKQYNRVKTGNYKILAAGKCLYYMITKRNKYFMYI